MSNRLVRHAEMPYHDDLKAAIRTMEYLGTTRYPQYALSHCEVISGEQIADLVRRNLALEEAILARIEEDAAEPVSEEELTDQTLARMIRDPEYKYAYIVRHSIRSHIDYLVQENRLKKTPEGLFFQG